MSQFLNRLGQASARHKWRVLGLWVIGVIVVASLASSFGGEPVDNFRLPDSDAQRAIDVLHRSFPSQGGSSAELVFQLDTPVEQGTTPKLLHDAADRIRRLPHVGDVSDPLAPGAISADGTIARAEVRYDESTIDLGSGTYDALRSSLQPVTDAGVKAEIGGPLAAWENRGDFNGEQIGLLVAVFVLTFVFGSVLAMLLPMGLALITVAVGGIFLTLIAGFADVPSATEQIAAMIGLGVALDYALFIVSRFVDRVRAGDDPVAAAGHASASAGLAVLFAGSTVIIAITGLMLSGVTAIGLIGVGVAAVVVAAVLGALTLLPALLGILGGHAVRSRLPFLRTAAARENRRASQWARAVVNHPVLGLLGALVVLLAIAAPVLSLRLGQVDAGTAAPSTSQRKSFDLLAQGFGPGFNDPLLLVVDGPNAADPNALATISQSVAADPSIAAVSLPQLNADKSVAVIQAFSRTSPHDEQTSQLVRRLRTGVLADTPGARVLVTGVTAGNVDLAAKMSERLPILILAVVAVSFLLLAIGFRSLLVPLKAAVMNILSIGVGYGVVVAVFQWGWGKGLLGLDETVPIVSWVPLLMFAILFGLSMDYEVFLISAIRAAHQRTGDNRQAVIEGLSTTARIITAAAAIMLVVFGSFVAYPDPTVKMVGLGLAVSILVDATIVWMVLVPATMVLLGEANWWLPAWLQRILPTIDLEGDDGVEPVLPVLPVPAPQAMPDYVGAGR